MPRAPWLRPIAVLVVLPVLLPGCGTRDRAPGAPAPPGAEVREELPPVAPAGQPITVRVWAEPGRLPPAGGQAQIIVQVRTRAGEPLGGVEVRLTSSEGALFSGGKILTTDESGRTRDRLTARRPAVVTVDAGGTVQTVAVDVAAPPR